MDGFSLGETNGVCTLFVKSYWILKDKKRKPFGFRFFNIGVTRLELAASTSLK